MLITEINGKKISSLDDFAAAARAVAPGSAGYVVARDLTSTSSPIGGKVSELTFNVARYPLQLFAWDQAKLDWVVVEGGRKSGGGEKKGADAAAGAADAVGGGDGGSGIAQAASDSSSGGDAAPAVREAAVSSASSGSVSASSSKSGRGNPGGRSLLQQNASSSSSSSSSSTNKPAAADATSGPSGGSAPIDAPPKPAVGPGSANAEGAGGAAAGGAGGGLGGGGGGSGRAAGGASSASSSVPSSPRAASNVWSPEDRARLKRGVVSVRASTDIPLGNAVRADASSSGFIAAEDDGRLIVVTDARADNSPTDYTVFFHDGSSAKARPLFSDYATFLEVDRKDAPKNVEVLPVGSGLSDVPVGSRLLLVAASEDGTASDQEGTLLVRNSQLQTNINVARNSKSAPVLDSRGKVVAVHASNSDAGTLSFETPVSSFEFFEFFSEFFVLLFFSFSYSFSFLCPFSFILLTNTRPTTSRPSSTRSRPSRRARAAARTTTTTPSPRRRRRRSSASPSSRSRSASPPSTTASRSRPSTPSAKATTRAACPR